MITPAEREKLVLCPGDTKIENQMRTAKISLCENYDIKESGQSTKLSEWDLVCTTSATLASRVDLSELHQSPVSDNNGREQLDPWPFLRCSEGELLRSKKLKSSYLILKSWRCWEGRWPEKKAAYASHWERGLLSFPIVSSAEGFLKMLRVVFAKKQSVVLFV